MRASAIGRISFVAVSLAILTAAFLWPALVTGDPWSFPDTSGYYIGGASAWNLLTGSLLLDDVAAHAGAASPGSSSIPGIAEQTVAETDAQDGGTAALRSDDLSKHSGIRSVPYSLFVYVSIRLLGIWAPIVTMCLAIAVLVWMTARDVPPALRLAIGLCLAAFTVLPFFGALFQPDILTAAVVLVPIILMLHGDRLGIWHIIALFALFEFAAVAHYGNVPLAGMAVLWLGIWGLMRGRRLLVAISVASLALAVLANVAVGVANRSGPSLAPGRFPIMLARSIEDGPGQAYLAEACPEADWTLCDAYDEVPSNVGAFLWGPRGYMHGLTDEQRSRVSAEELSLLVTIFRYDPIGQTRAFLGNAIRQFLLYDSAEGQPARYTVMPGKMRVAAAEVEWTPSVPARAQNVAILLGIVACIWAIFRRTHPEALAVAYFPLASMIVYAAICGGLSAPVPRYQAKLVWLVPLLGAVLATGRRSSESPQDA